MIRVRWTDSAYNDLPGIADYLFEHSPDNAEKLIRRIHDASTALQSFPNRGRSGKKAGTRELVVPSLPYIVVYRVETETVVIFRVLHAAQDWRT